MNRGMKESVKKSEMKDRKSEENENKTMCSNCDGRMRVSDGKT